MKKSVLVIIALVVVVAAVLGRRWWVKSTAEVAALAAGPPPAAVVPDSGVVVLTGRVSAGGTEPIRAGKAGHVRSIYFSSGQYVRRGAVLAKLTDYNFVVAPHGGFLGECKVGIGQYVTPATVVGTISKRPYLLVPVALPAGSAARVQPDDSVRVWASARPTRVVTGVARPAADTAGGITLEIRLTSRAPLRIGEVASVQLHR